ncbi:MAG: hypothetical protein WBM50_14450 [Acidimicrobiales bacterium]
MSDDSLRIVQALLDGAGLAPPQEEVERLAGLYPGLRKTVDRIHQVDVGDEVTAAVFRADLGPGTTGSSGDGGSRSGRERSSGS